MSTPAQKAARRRKILPGYPVETAFQTPEQLAEYFSGSRITCLRCGKQYRALGLHLVGIHEMHPDEYKKIYNIPWTYGLDCADTTDLKSEVAKTLIANGTRALPTTDMAAMRAAKKRERQPIRDVLVQRNLEKLNKDKPGLKARWKKAAPARGSEEYKAIKREISKRLPQAEALKTYWLGRKQTPEHIRKRTERKPR